jgi:hypothetical protein
MKSSVVPHALACLAVVIVVGPACGVASQDDAASGGDQALSETTTLTFTERCTSNAQALWFAPGEGGRSTPIAYVKTGGSLVIENTGTKKITVFPIPWGKKAAGQDLDVGKSMSVHAPSKVEDVADGDFIYEIQCDGDGASSVDIKAHPDPQFCGLGGAGNTRCTSAQNEGG